MIDLAFYLVIGLPLYAGGILIAWMIYRIVRMVWLPHSRDELERPQFHCEKCGREIRTFSSRCPRCGSINWNKILPQLVLIVLIYMAFFIIWTGFIWT